jgi:formimidoylglutamate deiminase
MPRYRAPLALLPDGWARDVLLEVDAEGSLAGVTRGGDADGGGDAGGGGGMAVSAAHGVAADAHSLPGVVVPGVVNLHSHAFQRALAGRAERGSPSDETFWNWRERMYAFLRVVEPDDVEAIAAQLYAEMLRHGYTSVCEFQYLHLDPAGRPYADPAEMSRRLVAAAEAVGIGLTLLPVLYVSGDFGGAPPTEGQHRFVLSEDRYLRLLEAAREMVPERVGRAGLAFHSLRAVPPEVLARVLDAAGEGERTGSAGEATILGGGRGQPVHIHVAEQRREVAACLAWSGQRPVAWLLDHAPVDHRWCLVHATHLDDAEVVALAGSGAVAGLCPTTEANLGDGLFRLPEYLAAEGRLGIGSDSHVGVSPVEELRWLEYGQRLTLERRNVAPGSHDRSTARTLLDAAWSGGAQASGRAVGRLERGARADWLVLDPDHPALIGHEGDALLDAWIFSGNNSPVIETWVGGRRVVEGGRHVRADEFAARFRGNVQALVDRS